MTYTNKTQATNISPEAYLKKNFKGKEKIQKDAMMLIDAYSKATGSKCVMWIKIFGFGKYYYFDSKGREHDYLMSGFAISSTGFTLYNLMGWKSYEKETAKLGKFKFSGKSCLAIKSVEDIDLKVLKNIIKASVSDLKKKYKTEK